MTIFHWIHKYILTKCVDMKDKIPGSDLEMEKIFIPTLVGGDLLSTMRALYIRGGSELEEDWLKGILPVSEDWHGKVCFMEVTIITE